MAGRCADTSAISEATAGPGARDRSSPAGALSRDLHDDGRCAGGGAAQAGDVRGVRGERRAPQRDRPALGRAFERLREDGLRDSPRRGASGQGRGRRADATCAPPSGVCGRGRRPARDPAQRAPAGLVRRAHVLDSPPRRKGEQVISVVERGAASRGGGSAGRSPRACCRRWREVVDGASAVERRTADAAGAPHAAQADRRRGGRPQVDRPQHVGTAVARAPDEPARGHRRFLGSLRVDAQALAQPMRWAAKTSVARLARPCCRDRAPGSDPGSGWSPAAPRLMNDWPWPGDCQAAEPPRR